MSTYPPYEAGNDIYSDQQLRAGIEALCEGAGASLGLNGSVFVNDLRALLADDGAAALHEHDQRIRRDLAQEMNDDRTLFHAIETRVLGDALGAADDIQDIVVAWLRNAGEAGE